MTRMPCEYCKNTSTRNTAHPGTTETVHVCEVHYKILKPQRGNKLPAPIDELTPCARCGTKSLSPDGRRNNIYQHHIWYGRDVTIPLCLRCHREVHNDEDDPLHPVDSEQFPQRPLPSTVEFDQFWMDDLEIDESAEGGPTHSIEKLAEEWDGYCTDHMFATESADEFRDRFIGLFGELYDEETDTVRGITFKNERYPGYRHG